MQQKNSINVINDRYSDGGKCSEALLEKKNAITFTTATITSIAESVQHIKLSESVIILAFGRDKRFEFVSYRNNGFELAYKRIGDSSVRLRKMYDEFVENTLLSANPHDLYMTASAGDSSYFNQAPTEDLLERMRFFVSRDYHNYSLISNLNWVVEVLDTMILLSESASTAAE